MQRFKYSGWLKHYHEIPIDNNLKMCDMGCKKNYFVTESLTRRVEIDIELSIDSIVENNL